MIPDSLNPADDSDGIRDRLREHLLVVNDEIEDGGVEDQVKIRIRNLTKFSDGMENPILRGISLDIPKGKIVGIIGPSGGGKSTTLRALNRLWEPPAETVFLDGHDIVNLDVLGLRRKVGMLFQIPVLFEGTVADNIRYGPQLRGKKLSDGEVHKLLGLADLDSSFFSKIGSELSVGQAQRVALARTLANAPENMGALPNSFSFSFFSLIFLFTAVSPAAADPSLNPLLPHPFPFRFKALEGTAFIASTSPPPLSSAPPPEDKPIYSAFRPSMAVVVGVLTTTFSITFLLLLYAKHCKRGNAAVVGYSRHPNSVPSFTARKNSGIDQAVIESLPIFRFESLSGQKDGLECAVCLNKFEQTEILRLLPKCKHAFHVECVDTWLDAHSTCPLCRYRVDPEDVLLVEEVNVFLHNPPPPPPPPDSKSNDVVALNLEQGSKIGSGRVSGRHSSVGEKRTGESSRRDPALLRRSLDSSKTVAIGCFDRHRKDGLLLLGEEKTNQNQNMNRFEHRIIVSPAVVVGGKGRERWSDVEGSDLLYLRSEMIISDSRRFSVASLPPELKRQRRMMAGKGTGMTTTTMMKMAEV